MFVSRVVVSSLKNVETYAQRARTKRELTDRLVSRAPRRPSRTLTAANHDCCASLPVTGGSFFRGYDGVTDGDTSKAFPATVSDFRLDRYEVTVGRFRLLSSFRGSQVAWYRPYMIGVRCARTP